MKQLNKEGLEVLKRHLVFVKQRVRQKEDHVSITFFIDVLEQIKKHLLKKVVKK